jgi:hypothetical protein
MVLLQQSFVALAACILPFCKAAPVAEDSQSQPARAKDARQINLEGIVGPIVTSVLSGLAADATDGASLVSAIAQAAGSTLGNQIPPPPENVPDAVASLSSIFAAAPTDLVTNILQLVPAGFPANNIDGLTATPRDPRNSQTNVNPHSPDTIYPQKESQDAPYSLTETQLRQVIYIPPTFTYGQKPPVVLVPGTGVRNLLPCARHWYN